MHGYFALKLTKTPSSCHLITSSQLRAIIVSLYTNIMTSSRPFALSSHSPVLIHTPFSLCSHVLTYFHPHSHIVTFSTECPHTRSYPYSYFRIRVSPYPHLLIISSHPHILILKSSVAYRGEDPPPLNSEGPPKSCETRPDCENC